MNARKIVYLSKTGKVSFVLETKKNPKRVVLAMSANSSKTPHSETKVCLDTIQIKQIK